jgi:pentatricopeptide repeat protein
MAGHVQTWVKMIQLHASAGSSKKAEELFRAMRASGVLPTASIYDALLVAYCRAGCLDQAFSVFREYKLVWLGNFLGGHVWLSSYYL